MSRRALVAVIVSIAVVAVGVALILTSLRHSGNAKVAARSPAPSPASASLLASAPAPTSAIAEQTVTYLAGRGKVLDRHEKAASAVLALSSQSKSADCRSAARALDDGGHPSDVLKAAASVPDEVLRELVVGEHGAELAALRVCGKDQGDLAGLVSDVRRLHDAVGARRSTLEAAAKQ